ncbi:MAG: tetratricopeptide repeat protein [Magnetococcales bacterium]|nr:tetratricopeptide repeat protein [Magnetococcales bacterium]
MAKNSAHNSNQRQSIQHDENSLLTQAITYHQANRLEEAIFCYKKVLEIQPKQPYALNNLGFALYSLGRFVEAIDCCKKAILIKPDFAEAYNNLGNAYKYLGNLEEGAQNLLKAITLKSNFFEAYNNLGNIKMEQDKLDEAVIAYQNAITINPGFVMAYSNFGNVKKKQGEMEQAIEYYKKAITLNPSNPEAHYNIGIALQEQKKHSDAVTSFQKAISLNPNFISAHCSLGISYQEQEKLDEAVASYNNALAIDPNHPKTCCNLGNALTKLYKLEESIAYCKKAISINPKYYQAYNNLALALLEQRKLQEAKECYLKAIEIEPNNLSARYSLGFIDLSLGNIDDGWRGYEYRLQLFSHKHNKFSYPRWNGETLTGKSILVYAEEGIGDEITSATFYQELAELADSCTILCDPRLESLFTRSFPSIKFIGVKRDEYQEIQNKLPTIDYQAAMSSLASKLRPNCENLKPCLVADPNRTDYWRKKLDSLGPEPKIGISWTTSKNTVLRLKAHSNLLQWKEILTLKGVTFINLFHGPDRKDIEAARSSFGATIIDFSNDEIDLTNDIDELYALMAALDMIITSPSMIATLSCQFGSKSAYFFTPRLLWKMLGKDYPLVFMDAEPLFFTNDEEFVLAAKKGRNIIEKFLDL